MRKVVFCAAFLLLSCGPGAIVPQPTVTPKPSTPDVAPIGEKGAYATPPQQTAPWTPPSNVPADVVAVAKKLFDSGLADPRGCTYREIEILSLIHISEPTRL